MPTDIATTHIRVEIDGNPLAPSVKDMLARVVVDDHLHLPDGFTLRFADPNGDVLDQMGVDIGSEVTITAGPMGRQGTHPLMTGEVTGLEADHGSHGRAVVVRGYDPSHRLHRGHRTETYRNVKVSDVARTVASRAHLSVGTIEETDGVLEHVSQANLTDWDFLKSLARENGFEMCVVDGKFHFRRPVASSNGPETATDYDEDDPLKLVYGTSLMLFQPRLSSMGQVPQVQARGWDPEQKQVVVGTADVTGSHAKLSSSPADLAQPFGSSIYVTTDRPVATQSAIDAVAHSAAEQVGSPYAEAEGIARGDPRLRAGTAISVAKVGDDFDGQYTLTSTRHVFDDDGYLTHFTISGRCDRSLLGLASIGATNGSASGGGPPIYGLVIAQVTDNNDPNSQARVKLKFPWLSDSYESDWCRLAQTGAGPDSGVSFIPEVNDEVLVAFEFGDIRRPYVIGGLHNGQDKPRLGDGLFDNGKVKRRGIVSRKGHRFVIFDDDGKSGMALMSSDGKLKVSLNETNNQITIHCDGAIQIDTQSGDVTVKGGGNVTVEAQQQLTLKGPSGVTIDAGSGMVQVSGSQIMLG